MVVPFVLLAALVNVSARAPLQCGTNARVAHAIAGLGQHDLASHDRLAILASAPVVAACQLIRSLHVVDDTHIAGYEQDKHAKAMRVIWALRALRYLTDCQDFRAPTVENPAEWDELRRDWLLRDNAGAPVKNWNREDSIRFFATWMSRDSVFIAPRDVQEKVIARWLQWYVDVGSHGFQFKTCESVDRWYF